MTSSYLFILAPRLVIGAVYKQLGEKMKLLWTKDLKMNTVHVRDVVRALWHLRDAGPPNQVYNLGDKGETSKKKGNTVEPPIMDPPTRGQPPNKGQKSRSQSVVYWEAPL